MLRYLATDRKARRDSSASPLFGPVLIRGWRYGTPRSSVLNFRRARATTPSVIVA